jgi:hypothetical protein
MSKKKKEEKHRDCRKITRCMDCLMCVAVKINDLDYWWCKAYGTTVKNTHDKPAYCGIEWIIIVSKGKDAKGENDANKNDNERK